MVDLVDVTLAVVRDFRLPDVVLALIKAEGKSLFTGSMQHQVLLLAIPNQPMPSLAENVDGAVLSDDCRAEAAHVVELAVQRFGPHPDALHR